MNCHLFWVLALLTNVLVAADEYRWQQLKRDEEALAALVMTYMNSYVGRERIQAHITSNEPLKTLEGQWHPVFADFQFYGILVPEEPKAITEITASMGTEDMVRDDRRMLCLRISAGGKNWLMLERMRLVNGVLVPAGKNENSRSVGNVKDNVKDSP